MKNSRFGFTLIELLIVIALLGALAVGLLAALDPFEQLKKGTDTGVRNTVAELHGAVIRYYGIKNYMPWCTTDSTCAVKRDGEDDVYTTASLGTAWTTTIPEIENAGELKSGFSGIAGTGAMGKIKIFGSNTTAQIKVCYKPTAKSFILDPNTKYDPTNGVADCTVAAASLCLWCVE